MKERRYLESATQRGLGPGQRCDDGRRGAVHRGRSPGKIVKAAFGEDGDPVPPDTLCDIPTIDELFDIIGRNVSRLGVGIDAGYDSRLGYPTFTASKIKGVVDTCFGYEIRRLDVDRQARSPAIETLKLRPCCSDPAVSGVLRRVVKRRGNRRTSPVQTRPAARRRAGRRPYGIDSRQIISHTQP